MCFRSLSLHLFWPVIRLDKSLYSVIHSNTDIPKEREEVEKKKGGKKNPIWEINSQHPTEPVLGSLAHSVLSYPLASCSKAKHVFDTRLEGIWRRYRFLLCFTLHRESVCVCQGWDFFSLPPPLPPSLPPFFFSLVPLPSSPGSPSPTPNTKSVNHKPFLSFLVTTNCYLKAQTLRAKVSNLSYLGIKVTIFGWWPKVVTASEEFEGWIRGGILDREGGKGGSWGCVGEVWLPLEIFLNPLHQLFSASWGPSPGLLWG